MTLTVVVCTASLLYTSTTLFHLRMPDSGSREDSEGPDLLFKTTFITSLTVYNPSKKTKTKAADKLVKVKEIDFTVTEDNYLDILSEILKSHSQDKYKVTARRHYGFKYIYPPSKAYVNSYQIDVVRH